MAAPWHQFRSHAAPVSIMPPLVGEEFFISENLLTRLEGGYTLGKALHP
jgi:hypothetical protein